MDRVNPKVSRSQLQSVFKCVDDDKNSNKPKNQFRPGRSNILESTMLPKHLRSKQAEKIATIAKNLRGILEGLNLAYLKVHHITPIIL